MSMKKDGTIMSFRLPNFMREELSRAADSMNMSDSNFLRVAITSALMKYAKQGSQQQSW